MSFKWTLLFNSVVNLNKYGVRNQICTLLFPIFCIKTLCWNWHLWFFFLRIIKDWVQKFAQDGKHHHMNSLLNLKHHQLGHHIKNKLSLLLPTAIKHIFKSAITFCTTHKRFKNDFLTIFKTSVSSLSRACLLSFFKN